MHLLVIRFSAMGDVALLVPAVKSLLDQNADLQITVLSRPFFKPLFDGEERLHFFGADVSKKYKGLARLWQLTKDVSRNNNFDAVVDVHDVLRSRILSGMFRLQGLRVLRFDKGRSEKKAMLTSRKLKPLLHATQRYLHVFEALKLQNKLVAGPWLNPQKSKVITAFLEKQKQAGAQKFIGIAPFAMHASKEWGLLKIVELLKLLAAHSNFCVLLLGGGRNEAEQLETIAKLNDNAINATGIFSFDEELQLISQLDVMLSMDSANMHLAAICSTPVVSIWGPTHAYLGFGPLDNAQHIVEVSTKDLPCRPCSVFGKLATPADEACAKKSMEQIAVNTVYQKLISVLDGNDARI